LYEYSDHQLSGLAIEVVFLENRGIEGFFQTKLYQATLTPNQIEVILQLSSGFQKNFPIDKSKGLPAPDFSVYTQTYFD
jgi:elongation factor P hydroxylase